MSDSDEEKVLLHDQSMDEVHELEDTMQASAASERLRGISSSNEDSDEVSVSSDSSSEDEGFPARNGGASMVGRAREESSDDDSDEPPEIPGSPIAQKLQTDFGVAVNNSRLLPDRSDAKAAANFDRAEEEEYEVKEVEQPRAAEFFSSSSSEDEEDSDSGRTSRDRNQLQMKMERSAIGRPKTAAKELEKYRDFVPNDFFQQFEGATTVGGASSPTFNDDSASRRDISTKNSARTASRDRESDLSRGMNKRQYKVPVPQEVEKLFSVPDAYTPEEIELETRLEPFLPEFTPSVGLPFDGIKIPRPDGKEENIGVDVLREPSGETNIAELELLMKISMTHQSKLRSRSEIVRSIEWAAQRPQEIDQWIASVDKAQRTKTPAQVNYKKPMPPLSQLMELWPEDFENFLAARGTTTPALSELDVTLKELAKISCVMLDIPVYEGNYVHSLHVLFSFFLEIEAYERDSQQSLQR